MFSTDEKSVSHMFMVGDTITAVLKKYNFYDITVEEMDDLLYYFSKMNGTGIIRPGQRAKIPVLSRHRDRQA